MAMDLTAGTRATAVAAAAVMAVGMAVVLYGVAKNDLARSLGGACLTMTALTLIALVAIRRWTTDAHAERQRLAEATREADAERMRSIAVQAALEAEGQRLRRDAAVERESLEARLVAEREAMRAQFEEERDELKTNAFEQGVRMADRLKLDAPSHATVISLPTQAVHQRATEPTRDRGATR